MRVESGDRPHGGWVASTAPMPPEHVPVITRVAGAAAAVAIASLGLAVISHAAAPAREHTTVASASVPRIGVSVQYVEREAMTRAVAPVVAVTRVAEEPQDSPADDTRGDESGTAADDALDPVPAAPATIPFTSPETLDAPAEAGAGAAPRPVKDTVTVTPADAPPAPSDHPRDMRGNSAAAPAHGRDAEPPAHGRHTTGPVESPQESAPSHGRTAAAHDSEGGAAGDRGDGKGGRP